MQAPQSIHNVDVRCKQHMATELLLGSIERLLALRAVGWQLLLAGERLVLPRFI